MGVKVSISKEVTAKVTVKVKVKLRVYNRVSESEGEITYRDKEYHKTCNQDTYLASCQDQS